jgi:hypothetical protein
MSLHIGDRHKQCVGCGRGANCNSCPRPKWRRDSHSRQRRISYRSRAKDSDTVERHRIPPWSRSSHLLHPLLVRMIGDPCLLKTGKTSRTRKSLPPSPYHQGSSSRFLICASPYSGFVFSRAALELELVGPPRSKERLGKHRRPSCEKPHVAFHVAWSRRDCLDALATH